MLAFKLGKENNFFLVCTEKKWLNAQEIICLNCFFNGFTTR